MEELKFFDQKTEEPFNSGLVDRAYSYILDYNEASSADSGDFSFPLMGSLLLDGETLNTSFMNNYSSYSSLILDMESYMNYGHDVKLMLTMPFCAGPTNDTFYYLSHDFIMAHNTAKNVFNIMPSNNESMFDESAMNKSKVYRLFRTQRSWVLERIFDRDDPNFNKVIVFDARNLSEEHIDDFIMGYKIGFELAREENLGVKTISGGKSSSPKEYGFYVGAFVYSKMLELSFDANISGVENITKTKLALTQTHGYNISELNSLVKTHNNILDESKKNEVMSNIDKIIKLRQDTSNWNILNSIECIAMLANLGKIKEKPSNKSLDIECISESDIIKISDEIASASMQFRLFSCDEKYITLRIQFNDIRHNVYSNIGEPKNLVKSLYMNSFQEFDMRIHYDDAYQIFSTLEELDYNSASYYSGSNQKYCKLSFSADGAAIDPNTNTEVISSKVLKKELESRFLEYYNLK